MRKNTLSNYSSRGSLSVENSIKKPIFLLDFDDVINIPLNKPIKENSDYKWRRKSQWDWDSWSSLEFKEFNTSKHYIITTNTEMIQKIKSLESDGLCEIIWLTTWLTHDGSWMNILSPDIIDSFAVSESKKKQEFKYNYDFLSNIMGAKYPAAGGQGLAKPSYVGSHLMDNWWKISAVRNLRRKGHPVVFADDMFNRFRRLYKDEENADDHLKLIRVNHHLGYTVNDFNETMKFLESFN